MSVIQVQHLSKRFIIQHEKGNAGKYSALRDVIADKVKGFAKRKESFQQEEFWALKDVSFNIEQGDRVGIVGRNGAGKSTLLKVLSRITEPTSGSVKIKGRVASLLEVGTGFHPELTGRENIFLNGAILGMSRVEIRSKFDEIVAFAEVEKFLDTPVKRYSSGMYVRLAFAVAAHLEPEILIVDEVLAVGDAQFQRKCLGKMADVSKNGGRTVLFVSHSMEAVMRLCSHAILLKNGCLQESGRTETVINSYLRSDFGTTSIKSWELNGTGNDIVKLFEVRVHDESFKTKETFDISEILGISMKYKVIKGGYKLSPALNFFNGSGVNIFDAHECNTDGYSEIKEQGDYESVVWIPSNLLSEGTIIIGAAIVTHNPFTIHLHERDVIAFNMVDKSENNLTRGDYVGSFPGIIRPLLKWESKKNYKNV